MSALKTVWCDTRTASYSISYPELAGTLPVHVAGRTEAARELAVMLALAPDMLVCLREVARWTTCGGTHPQNTTTAVVNAKVRELLGKLETELDPIEGRA